MIAAGDSKKGLKSGVNSRLKSDPIIDIDFSIVNKGKNTAIKR